MPYSDFGYPEDLTPLMDNFSDSIDRLMLDLKEEKITETDWRDTFAYLLALYISMAYITGSGNETITGDAFTWVGGWLATQLDYLNNFANTIRVNKAAGGEYSEAWTSRAQLYVGSMVTPFWYGETEGLPLPALPGDGSSACGQLDACGWVITWLGDRENGNANAYWKLNQRRHAKTHCQQCLERSEKWAPLKIRNWELVLPDTVTKQRQAVQFKHLPGEHDQDTHGQRGGASEGDIYTEEGPKPSWAGDKVTTYAGYTLRNGRFANKNMWIVDNEGKMGPGRETPEQAVKDFIEMSRESARMGDLNRSYNAAIEKIKTGTHTEEDLKRISHGRPNVSLTNAIGAARAAGLRAKDANEQMKMLTGKHGIVTPDGYYLLPVKIVADRIYRFLSEGATKERNFAIPEPLRD